MRADFAGGPGALGAARSRVEPRQEPAPVATDDFKRAGWNFLPALKDFSDLREDFSQATRDFSEPPRDFSELPRDFLEPRRDFLEPPRDVSRPMTDFSLRWHGRGSLRMLAGNKRVRYLQAAGLATRMIRVGDQRPTYTR